MSESATQPFWTAEWFWIALFVFVLTIVVAFLYRGSKLKGVTFKSRGIEAGMTTHEQAMQEIDSNVLKGEKNKIATERGDTNIRGNTLQGKGNIIDVKTPKK